MNIHANATLGPAGRLALVQAIEGGHLPVSLEFGELERSAVEIRGFADVPGEDIDEIDALDESSFSGHGPTVRPVRHPESKFAHLR